ncbi:MAG: hypothetical protein AB1813_23380, partial [Verrucomicrobiota bacterium]
MLIALLFSIGTILHAADQSVAESSGTPTKPKPRAYRDPADQPFRFAPMASAVRSLVMPLATNVHAAFDCDLLRFHTVWKGEPLNLYGPPYHVSKSPFICDFEGELLWSFPPTFPWSFSAAPPLLQSRGSGAEFQTVTTAEGPPVLSYRFHNANDHTIVVQESLRLDRVGQTDVVVRRVQTGPCAQDLWFLAHAEMGQALPQNPAGKSLVIQRGNQWLVALARGHFSLEWKIEQGPVDYEAELITEEGTEKGWPKQRVKGEQVRALLKVPRHKEDFRFEICTAICRSSSEAEQLVSVLERDRDRLEPFDLTHSIQTGERRQPVVFAPEKSASFKGGDKFFRIERFPLPRAIRLQNCGMDWFANGDLAVCTWLGEIYVVENAQGPLDEARYRRFARGLNEPLGLKIVGDDLYVVHKPGLLRLRDTNRDGAADQFENVNDNWGYSGSYHAFAFGPVIDAQKNFYVLLTSQRGRWDIPYLGWCIRISPDGRQLEPICSGLRVPNGPVLIGDDLFCTDNEGNWIGTCKLNHLERGKFYGYPSSWPAPREYYEQKRDFTPPAVWLPRKLSPS